MSYFAKLADLGFMVVCRRNMLGTTAMFALRASDYETHEGFAQCGGELDGLLMSLPEWRVVDFRGDDAAGGARMLYEKLTCTGGYAAHDERLLAHEAGHVANGGEPDENLSALLIGFEHRPESERFTAVDA